MKTKNVSKNVLILLFSFGVIYSQSVSGIDTVAPSVPANLSATAISSTQIGLCWMSSTDNIRVAGYKILRGGNQIAIVTTNSYSDTGLYLSTSYTYVVIAYDSAGNTSAQSNSVTAVTFANGSSQAGWQELFNTQLQNVCPPSPGGSGGCGAVIKAWGGATARTKPGNEQLIIWGGGHGDYYGNEVYSLNLNLSTPTLTRLTDPSVIVSQDILNSGDTYLSDNLPVSRHTYNGLAYLPAVDRMFSFEGARMPNGGGGGFTWSLDLATTPPAWQKMYPTMGSFDPSIMYGSVSGAVCAYDPTYPGLSSVICNWGSNYEFLRYTYEDNTWTGLTGYSESIVPGASTAVIDPKRKLMIFIGPGGPYGGIQTPQVKVVDISPGSDYAVQDWSSQVCGCDSLAFAPYPGLAYDSLLDRIVGWPNAGNTVYVFNPDTKTCVPQTFPNGPHITTPFTGTFGRFRYFPSLDAFAVVNSADQNAFLLRLDPILFTDVHSSSKSENSSAITISYGNNIDLHFINMQTEKDVYIYDVTGKLMTYREKITSSEISLEKSMFTQGIYIVRAKTGDILVSKKLVIE